MNKKSLYTILVLIGGFSIALLISINKQEVTAQPYKQLIPSVRVMRVQPTEEHLIIISQGTVQPRNQSELIPEVTGRVTYMSAAMVNGGAFEENEILVRIDEADYLTLLRRSEAAVMRSEAEYELSKK
jgi:hypothetical protein